VTADLNADGRADLIGQVDGTSLPIYLGGGDGTFAPPILAATGNIPGAVAVGDVTGDGVLDIVANTSGPGQPERLAMLPGNGDGTFGAPVVSNVGILGYWYGAASIALADLNHDGSLDVVAGLLGLNSVGVKFGNGDGTFGDLWLTPVANKGPTAIALADFNNDGRVDVAALAPEDNVMSVLLGNAQGQFEGLVQHTVDQTTEGLAVGDLDGNGRTDILVAAGRNGRLTAFLNDGEGGFGAPIQSPSTAGAARWAWATSTATASSTRSWPAPSAWPWRWRGRRAVQHAHDGGDRRFARDAGPDGPQWRRAAGPAGGLYSGRRVVLLGDGRAALAPSRSRRTWPSPRPWPWRTSTATGVRTW